MRLWMLGLVACACATARPVVRTSQCQTAFDQCTNACFRSPHYPRNGPQCADVGTGVVCLQDGQPVDTLAAAKCFEQCEWDDKLCAEPVWQAPAHDSARDAGGGAAVDGGLLE